MKKSISMKRGLAIAAAAGITLGLGACAGSEDAGAAGNTITWGMWAGDDAGIKKLEAQMAVAQEIVGDDITIKLETAPWADYFTKLNANLSSGDIACVTGMNGQRLPGYASAFLPLGASELKTAGISRDDYEAGSLAVMEYDGDLLGLPYDTAAMTVYYNAELFNAAGVELPSNDWTIDEFQAAAEAITAGTGVSGFSVSLDEFQWLSLPMAIAGKQAVNEKHELDLTDPAFVEAADWYASLATELKVSDVPPSASENSWDANVFKAGDTAMVIDGTWNATTYISEDAPFEAGVVRIPAGDGGPYGVALGSGYGVSASCDNTDAALKVLGALSGPEVQKVIAEQGGFPAQTAVQSAYFDALPESTRQNISDGLTAAFEGSTAQRQATNWTQVSESFPTSLIEVYTGQKPMATMLDELQSKFGN